MRFPIFFRVFVAFVVASLFLGGGAATAQTYPPTPSFDTLVKDAQKDGVLDTLKSLGVPEAHLNGVRFERLNAQDKRNFTADVAYHKENASTFNDRLVAYVVAVVPKAALGASFRVPVGVKYTRYVETGDGNWSLLKQWKFHSSEHGLDQMVAPPDLAMPADDAKLAAIDAFFASKPDLSAQRFVLRRVLAIQKAGILTPHGELGVHEAVDLKTFVWRLAVRAEVVEERDDAGVQASVFDNMLFKFLVERSPDGRFTVTTLSGIAECSPAEAAAAGIGGEERIEVKHAAPLKVGNLMSAGWAAVQKKRAPYVDEPGSPEHLKRSVAQLADTLKGIRLRDSGEARALDAWRAPESDWDSSKVWEAVKYRLAVSAIERQESGVNFTFDGLKVSSASFETSHRPESGDSFRTIPAGGSAEIVITYKVQYRVDGSAREVDGECAFDVGLVAEAGRFLVHRLDVR